VELTSSEHDAQRKPDEKAASNDGCDVEGCSVADFQGWGLTKGVNRTNSRQDERRGRESGVHGGDWKIVAVGSGLNDWLGASVALIGY